MKGLGKARQGRGGSPARVESQAQFPRVQSNSAAAVTPEGFPSAGLQAGLFHSASKSLVRDKFPGLLDLPAF